MNSVEMLEIHRRIQVNKIVKCVARYRLKSTILLYDCDYDSSFTGPNLHTCICNYQYTSHDQIIKQKT